MNIAFLIPDNWENFMKYNLKYPYFGSAPTALLEGLSMINQMVNSTNGKASTGLCDIRDSSNITASAWLISRPRPAFESAPSERAIFQIIKTKSFTGIRAGHFVPTCIRKVEFWTRRLPISIFKNDDFTGFGCE